MNSCNISNRLKHTGLLDFVDLALSKTANEIYHAYCDKVVLCDGVVFSSYF